MLPSLLCSGSGKPSTRWQKVAQRAGWRTSKTR